MNLYYSFENCESDGHHDAAGGGGADHSTASVHVQPHDFPEFCDHEGVTGAAAPSSAMAVKILAVASAVASVLTFSDG